MKYIKEIAEILDIENPEEINESDELESLGFDSMVTIHLIGFITDRVDLDIEPEEIESLQTIKDLHVFICSKLDS